jgi:transposase
MAMVVPTIDHDCALTPVVNELLGEVEKLRRELAQMKKSKYGPTSERTKMPRVDAGKRSTPEEQLARRRANALEKSQTETIRIEHKVPLEQRTCPACGNDKLKPIGAGRESVVFEFIPARFVRHEHVQEVLRCKCGDYVVTAPGAPKVIEKGRYGAGFLAHLAVAKCADHTPIYRIEKDFRRQGFPLARSTMNELLHRASELTKPLWSRLLEQIRTRDIVMADETRLRMQDDGTGKAKTGFVWTFVGADEHGAHDVAFIYAAGRSGETPKRVLGDTAGYLLVDAYSGYNAVAEVSRRKRAACHAHLRRYFHEALATASIAQEAIDLILEFYRVEHEAQELKIVGSAQHLKLRKQKSTIARDKLKVWLAQQLGRHPPKSPIGIAIRYGQNHWDELGRFLDDARIPLDNNASERSLRRVALGRKNFLFVGDIDAGSSIAGLYTLIATCEARGINPFAYLTDVIARVQDHPAKRVDELLPGAWATARAA